MFSGSFSMSRCLWLPPVINDVLVDNDRYECVLASRATPHTDVGLARVYIRQTSGMQK